ncbi:MAG: DUF1016 domain-containing protein, partial [Bacteroidaceae bacterium]|nr:DUF1016 domain-containing protein [Bacteroidaceae bacterium]
MNTEKNTTISSASTIVDDIKTIINNGRAAAYSAVNSVMISTYWNIGRRIVEEEQHGKERADYGTYLIRHLAKELEPEYGSGFSVRQLEQSRQFYRTYPIANTL